MLRSGLGHNSSKNEKNHKIFISTWNIMNFGINKKFNDLNRFWQEKQQKSDHMIKHMTSVLKALILEL